MSRGPRHGFADPIRRRGREGLTLIEGAIAAAITMLIAAGLLAAISGAMAVWEHAGGRGTMEVDAWVTLHRVARDLRNAVPYPGIPVRVEDGRLQFAGVPDGEPFGSATGGLQRIEYRFDPEKRLLLRTCRAFPSDPRDSSPGEELLSGVEEVRFEGQEPSPSGAAAPAGISEEPSALPALIRVRITLATADYSLREQRSVFLRRVPRVSPSAGAGSLP